MSQLSKYRAEMTGHDRADVVRINVCAAGFEREPDVEVLEIVLRGMLPPDAENIATQLNKAFNDGREFARQR